VQRYILVKLQGFIGPPNHISHRHGKDIVIAHHAQSNYHASHMSRILTVLGKTWRTCHRAVYFAVGRSGAMLGLGYLAWLGVRLRGNGDECEARGKVVCLFTYSTLKRSPGLFPNRRAVRHTGSSEVAASRVHKFIVSIFNLVLGLLSSLKALFRFVSSLSPSISLAPTHPLISHSHSHTHTPLSSCQSTRPAATPVIKALSASPFFPACFLKYTLFANFQASHPAKNNTLSTATMPHSHDIPLCLNTTVFSVGIYKVGKIVTKPAMMDQKRKLFWRTSWYHCVKYFVDFGCMRKKLRRKLTISQARKSANQVKQTKVVARARNLWWMSVYCISLKIVVARIDLH